MITDFTISTKCRKYVPDKFGICKSIFACLIFFWWNLPVTTKQEAGDGLKKRKKEKLCLESLPLKYIYIFPY